ncbi:MAG: DUF1573 domain-containing protein [Bacteroidia bacterium]
MKTYFAYVFTLCTLLVSCKNDTQQGQADHVSPDIVNNPATASGESTAAKSPKFEFTENNFDFGTINSGEDVVHEFKFKNIGDADLIISQVKGSCGCTQPTYPEGPIAPGDEGIISVTFHSAGIAGQVVKDVTILANTTPTTKVLTISGEVIKVNNKIKP